MHKNTATYIGTCIYKYKSTNIMNIYKQHIYVCVYIPGYSNDSTNYRISFYQDIYLKYNMDNIDKFLIYTQISVLFMSDFNVSETNLNRPACNVPNISLEYSWYTPHFMLKPIRWWGQSYQILTLIIACILLRAWNTKH